MPKSGNTENRGRKPKAKKNIVNFPPTAKDVSPSSSPAENPKSEVAATDEDGLTPNILSALKRFKVPKSTYMASPEITPIIWRTMGNQKRAMETLRFSQDESCQKLLKVYYTLSNLDRETLPLEIVCLAAEVSPAQILGQLILCARDASRAESALLTMTEHPNVVKASIEFGKEMAGATKDREMIHKATGYLPSSQGSNINVNVFGKESQVEEDEEESAMPSDVFAYDSRTIEGWDANRRKLLEDGKK